MQLNLGRCNVVKHKVSVIIPTYKRSVFYLSRAVESVLQQTYDNIELVVVDDSPESYAERKEIGEYMMQICSEHENVVYIRNEKNLGGSLSRNRGIFSCSGEYITFLDDDDEYKPEKVEKQINFMQTEDCDMSFTSMVMYNTSGHVVDVRSYADIKSFDNRTLLRYHLTRKITGTPTFMYKAECLRRIGGFDDAKLGQEFYLMLKSIERGLQIRYFNDCDVIVYKHADGGISQGKNKITGENAVFSSIKARFNVLSVRGRMYATFRHWAVMAVAYKRNGMYAHILGAVVMALLSSPIDCIVEVYKFAQKIYEAERKA